MVWVTHLIAKLMRAKRTKIERPRYVPSVEAIDDPEVKRLFLRLETLKKLDYEFDIHGSWKHRYRYTRMPEKSLASLENELGVVLPDDCRRWLSSIGRGAGPGYGLECTNADYKPAFPPGDMVPERVVNDVRDLTPEILQGYLEENERQEFRLDYIFGVKSYTGLMLLCEHGCGWDSFLILDGPLKGYVIDDLAAATSTPDGAEGVFTTSSSGFPHTFFEWLEDWIEKSIQNVAKERESRIEKVRRDKEEEKHSSRKNK